jgi:DNA-binding response OmpR family regulator
MCMVGRNILLVGVADTGGALTELPVRVLALDTGAEAIRCLKEERIDTIISHWELIDLPDGTFLKRVTLAKPATPTIAFIRPGDTGQEIAARGLGVDAVLNEDVGDAYFRQTVCQLLRVSAVSSIHLAESQCDAALQGFDTAEGMGSMRSVVTNN